MFSPALGRVRISPPPLGGRTKGGAFLSLGWVCSLPPPLGGFGLNKFRQGWGASRSLISKPMQKIIQGALLTPTLCIARCCAKIAFALPIARKSLCLRSPLLCENRFALPHNKIGNNCGYCSVGLVLGFDAPRTFCERLPILCLVLSFWIADG